MLESLPDLKKAELEKRLDTLVKQYKSANAQLRSTLDAADKPAIRERIDQLELEIQQVENALSQLRLATKEQKVFINHVTRELSDYLPEVIEACQRQGMQPLVVNRTPSPNDPSVPQ